MKMARPRELHVWTFLVVFVLSHSSLFSHELENVIGAKGVDELSENTIPRNFSQEPFQYNVQTQQNPNQNGGEPSGENQSNTTEPTLENLANLQNENKKNISPTRSNSRYESHGSIHSRTATAVPFIQNEKAPLILQDTPLDIPVHVEAIGDAHSMTTVLTNPVAFEPIKQPSLTKPTSEIGDDERSLAETLFTSVPAALNSNPLDSKSKLVPKSSSHEEDLKSKAMMDDNDGPAFQTLGVLPKDTNDFEIFAHVDNNMGNILSSVRPTVSTISLVTGQKGLLPEISKMHTTEYDLKPGTQFGDDQDIDLDQRKNSVEALDHLPSIESNVLLPPQTGTEEPHISGARRVENNYVDDNFVLWNDKESKSLASEKYLASYRTTQSVLSLQERHDVLTSPASNDVLSIDVEDMAESVLDNMGNSVKTAKTAQGASWKQDENMVTANSGAFYHPKPTTEIDISGNSHWVLMATKAPKQDHSTWLTSKGNQQDSHIPYAAKDVTLESKAKAWTEKLFAHQLSTRKPISNPVQEVDDDKDVLSASNSTIKVNERMMGKFPKSNQKTPAPDIHISFLTPRETATPFALALSKEPVKIMEELDKSSALAQKGTAGPVLTPKNGTSPMSLESVTPATWMTPAPDYKTTWPNSIPHPRASTSSPPINSSQTPIFKRPVTRRVGQIRVTTQRALQKPRIIDASSSSLLMEPSLSPPCQTRHGACEYLMSNRTLIEWNDLKRTLSFAWEMHVYGTAVLFLILAVIAMINLIGSPILHVFHLPYVMVSNALLVLVGILRTVYFFTDPYATKSMLSPQTSLVLYNITFPLILTTFAILVLLMLKMAQLQMLPPKLQNLPLLAVVAVIHFIILFSTDLFSHFLNRSVNVVLHILSASWGTFLMVGNAMAYYKLRKHAAEMVSRSQMESPLSDETLNLQMKGRNLKCLFTSSRVLLVCSVFGLLCCGLQVYSVLWLFEILGKVNVFSWSWWFLQFWFRIFELGLCYGLLFVASLLFCQKCGNSDHTCWAKIVQYLCPYSKTEVPEYPNNCYDWANGHPDRSTNNDISKNLIRNAPESVPLRALKDNNENKLTTAFFNSGSSSPIARVKAGLVFGPKSQNVAMGRSRTSICFERDSMLSLADLEFRPPSPINLSRSIDEALFKEHLVRDSIFLDSSLQYPSYLSRQDSCSSLKECSALNQTIDPLISADLKLRRNSIPEYMYSLARCSSLTDINSPSESLQPSKELPNDVSVDAAASGSSLESFSKGSIKISWNPWRHGLSSVESLPLEDAASSHLLAQDRNAPIPAEAKEQCKKDSAKSLIKIGQPIDSNSISSDTIEL